MKPILLHLLTLASVIVAVLKLGTMFGAVSVGLNLDREEFTSMLKDVYSPDNVAEIQYKKQPYYQRIGRDKNHVGEARIIGLRYANGQGIGGTFATAKTNKVPSKNGRFTIGRQEMFGFTTIEHHLIKATKNDTGSLLRAKSKEIDGMLFNMSRRHGIHLFRNGSGVIGQLNQANVTQNLITLERRSDIRNFELEMVLKFHADDTGTGVTRAGEVQVKTINRRLGTMTLDAVLDAGVPTVADGDYISVSGDYGKAGMGLAGYIPVTEPGAGDNLFGMDRSDDPTRKAGVRLDVRGWSYQDAITELLNEVSTEGGDPGVVYTNPIDWVGFERELGSKVTNMYTDIAGTGKVGFKGIKVHTQDAEAMVMADINCPQGLAYALQEDTFELLSIGETPEMWDEDGLVALRASNSNDLDIQAFSYYELACDAPGYNGVAQIG